MSENYNIFKVLKLQHKETIHSAMIAAIASHNSQSREAFYEMLKKKHVFKSGIATERTYRKGIECLNLSIDYNSNRQWIDTEKNLKENVLRKDKQGKDKQVSVNRGRADIWIGTNRKIWNAADGNPETKQFRLIIENKINAGNQDRQLRRYYRYLIGNNRENAGLFFLCVKNCEYCRHQAEDSAITYNSESGDNKEYPTEYSIITYEEDIKNWLEEVIKTADGDFREVVKDYYKLVTEELVKKWKPKKDKYNKSLKTS